MDTNHYINTSISYSFIILLDEYLQVLNNSLYTSAQYFDEDIHQILNKTSSLFIALPDILTSDSSTKTDCVQNIISFKAALENKYRTLSAYQRELDHLYILRFFSGNQRSNEDTTEVNLSSADENIDFDRLISDCTKFIYSSVNLSQRHQKATLLLPYIPTKMTVESFINYAKKSMLYIHTTHQEEDIKLLVSILKQLFKGSFYENYGKDLKDIYISIEELKTEDDSETFDENAQLLSETIDTLLSLIVHLYKVLCCFANLLILDQHDFEDLHKLHISFYDLYFSIKSILTGGENKQLFLVSLPDRTKDIRVQIAHSYEKVCKEIKPHNSSYSLFLLMQTYLSMDISSLFLFDIRRPDKETATTNGSFDAFLEELKHELLALDTFEKRLRMQYFISVIPFIMSKDTFITYFTKGMNQITSSTQKFAIGSYFESILEESGYFKDTANHTKH